MIIEFTRTGGLANMSVHVLIDTAKLASEVANDIESKFLDCDFFHLASSIGSTTNTPDGFHYRVRAQDGTRHHTIEVDGSADTTLGELLTLLTKIAKQARRLST
jgi:hypothetical protein